MMLDSIAPPRRCGPIAWLLIQPIRFYQKFITPYTPATCRYYPTCSAYAVGALRRHGSAKGLLLTVWRLLRCNPWSHGGVDTVPERGHWRAQAAGEGSARDGVIPVTEGGEAAANDFAHADHGRAPSAGRTAA